MLYKIGDKVQYKDGDTGVYTVLDVAGDQVSLSLSDYEDIEQDFFTNIDEIEHISNQ